MRVCFVCLGNICRSPTAEGVFRKLADDAGVAARLVIDSAGTGSWHVGELPDPRSREHAQKRGYALTHRARQFVADDFGRFDLVLAMDRSNLAHLQQLLAVHRQRSGGAAHADLHLLRAFEPGAPPTAEVPDPYAGGGSDFERVLDICERACTGLLAHVRERLR